GNCTTAALARDFSEVHSKPYGLPTRGGPPSSGSDEGASPAAPCARGLVGESLNSDLTRSSTSAACLSLSLASAFCSDLIAFSRLVIRCACSSIRLDTYLV